MAVWSSARRRGLLAFEVCFLVVAALLAGCAQASGTPPQATATSATISAPNATMTPLPAAPLQWRSAAMPAQIASASFYVAPSDGAVAYACLAPASDQSSDPIGRPLVWLTRDHAQSWSQMASIPADHLNNGCILYVDQRNPAIVVALLTWTPRGAGAGPDIRDSTNYVSFNSGATWRKLTDAQPFEMWRTATVNGTTYAIRGVLTGNGVHYGLWVSHDAMSSWRLIDPPGQTVDAMTFWLSPFSDALLVQYGEPDEVTSLWSSPDGGAHWSQLSLPDLYAFAIYSVGYFAMIPGAGKPWTICSDTVAVSGSTIGGDPLVCSGDGGKTWSRLPALTLAPSVTDSPQDLGRVGAMTSDGALLAMGPGGFYRLTSGAQQWQFLGHTSASDGLHYFTLSGETFWDDQLDAGPPTSPYR
ncbi:MAG TPA: hypothetical protein VHI51_16125 [Ktedonobacterales bacterium]|nr:hypothetical protein [Ktedonobacterales bacterium]